MTLRRKAVELVRFSGRPVQEIARDLRLTEQSLRNWIKQAEVDAGRAGGLSSDEKVELRELRRRVRTLEMERDVLKKPRLLRPRKRDVSAVYPFVSAENAATRSP